MSTRTDQVIAKWHEIKSMCSRGGYTLADLLAESSQNDPFSCGQPARVRSGEWFAGLWQAHGRNGFHLRRFHYQLVSQPQPPLSLNGAAYENTDRDWLALQTGFANARYLDLVDPTQFTERRSQDILVNTTHRDTRIPQPYVTLTQDTWTPPSLNPRPAFLLPRIEAAPPPSCEAYCEARGYDYDRADQPIHLVVLIEKSTMNDVLVPLCQEMGIDLIVGVGFSSVQRVIEILCQTHKQAMRFGYISDHDPAGKHMPIAVGRQLEFWRSLYAPHVEIKLTPLALTADQVRHYHLPRTPIKADDKRRDNYEQTYGEGATELDALEALYPGELAKIVRQFVATYRDRSFAHRLIDAEEEANDLVEAHWQATTTAERVRLAELQTTVTTLTTEYGAQLSDALAPYRAQLAELETQIHAAVTPIAEAFDADMLTLRGEIGQIQQGLQHAADTLTMALPPRPEPEIALPDESEWLFDSGRDYLSQATAYKHDPMMRELRTRAQLLRAEIKAAGSPDAL